MQTKCLRLMGKKLLVALTLDGKFAGEGLHDIEEDDDMPAALARELVAKSGIGERADAIWSELKQIYDQLPTTTQALTTLENDLTGFEATPDSVNVDGIPVSAMSQGELLVTTALDTSMPTLFGQTLSSGKRKSKQRPLDVPQQGSLFYWN